MRGLLRLYVPPLPRSVFTLQLGGLVNAFGNGMVVPFMFIYLGMGRYMALNALSWNIGFTLGPALGGLGLSVADRRLDRGFRAVRRRVPEPLSRSRGRCRCAPGARLCSRRLRPEMKARRVESRTWR